MKRNSTAGPGGPAHPSKKARWTSTTQFEWLDSTPMTNGSGASHIIGWRRNTAKNRTKGTLPKKYSASW